MSGTFRTEAPKYWRLGLSVVPLEEGEKRPAKEISGWQGYVNGPPSDEKRREWLDRYGERGIGLLTGAEIEPGIQIGAVDIDDDALVRVATVVVGDILCAKRGKKGLTIFVKIEKVTK